MHYGSRSRGEERDIGRSYGGRQGRHGDAEPPRSRSPFEARGRGGGNTINFESSITSTEQRLKELRRRLNMVDDKIAELGGAPSMAERR